MLERLLAPLKERANLKRGRQLAQQEQLLAQLEETAKVRGFFAGQKLGSEEAKQRVEAAREINRRAMKKAARGKVPESSAFLIEGLGVFVGFKAAGK